MCVATGTGSTSWYRAINSLNPQTIQDVLSMVECKKTHTSEEMNRLCFDFNSGLQYSAGAYKFLLLIKLTIKN